MSSITINDHLHTNGWQIKTSPDDGHCLLHSVITSVKSQLPHYIGHTLQETIAAIESEVSSNFIEYVSLGFEDDSDLQVQMDHYTKFKLYNSNFGDIVPLILSRALDLKITVLDTNSSGVVFVSIFPPRLDRYHSISIQPEGMHYNA